MRDPGEVDLEKLLSAFRRAEWIDLKGWNQDERIEGPELAAVVLALANLNSAKDAELPDAQRDDDRNAYGNRVVPRDQL